MMAPLQRLSNIRNILFGTRAGTLYMILFALVIGVATFIENDFGTSAAQKVIFRAWWFELLLALFAGSILNNIIVYRMVQQKKWPLLIFHLSIIIILLGSAITRSVGYEGVMHIREGGAENSILSSESYLQFEVLSNGNTYYFDEPLLLASLGNNNFSESYNIGDQLLEVSLLDFTPNPVQRMEESASGLPTLKIVFGSDRGRKEYFIQEGEALRAGGVLFNWTPTYNPSAINLSHRSGELGIAAARPLTQMTMATRAVDTLAASTVPQPLAMRSLYSDGAARWVFGDFLESAIVESGSENHKVKNESLLGLQLAISVDGSRQLVNLLGQKGVVGKAEQVLTKDTRIAVRYGAKPISLPFSVALTDFVMERYPGTNSAASFESKVQVIDPSEGENFDYRIYMNHILTYGGYRFFQSSYDPDEQGTYLSVNHDFWGTWVSYIGYALLTLGLIMVFFSRKSRFTLVRKKLARIRAEKQHLATASALLLLTLASPCFAQERIAPQLAIISADHADVFSQVIVQDFKGRMKPMHTLTREVMRKVSRREQYEDYTADQVVLSMFANKQAWLGIPLIKVGEHEELQSLLGVNDERAAYRDFFHTDGSYKLREAVRRAYTLEPIDRGTFEKELMKVDERLNIVSMVFSGNLLKVIPLSDDANNTWVSTASHGMQPSTSSPVADKFFSSYQAALQQGMSSGNYQQATTIVHELRQYQAEQGATVMPSQRQIDTELALNRSRVFERLAAYYGLLGLAFLSILFLGVFRPSLQLTTAMKVLMGLVIAGFVFQTLGLGARWYVSGRAPWSNGYESLIYIAWTSTLAGVIFTRKSAGGLAATMILASTILLVAMLSNLDPEITPLVPVLRSYWLTIHVSLEAGSYGFLMLAALIGFINLLLFAFLNERNKLNIKRIVTEMSYISEMTLMGGLVMISVGTYLGGVWANESWGRYWGWDAKETWALVTILIYAFILHMRLIPKLSNLFSYNVATLFGWASVLMTYFGVNYYLSGLHSYAAGDPIPVPSWVYYSVATLIIVSLIAYWKYRRVLSPPVTS